MKLIPALVASLVLVISVLPSWLSAASAADRAWNAQQTPFRIYGDTYYVGTHGITSILITSNAGHILIDGAATESAPQIAAHIRSLGFQLRDVKVILNSHVHSDHAGGLAALQRVTGATVMASPFSAKVLSTGRPDPADPQFGELSALPKVANVKVLQKGETVHVGPLALTAHSTPGHTRGGTSWTWTSCEGSRCYNVVYADSVSAISAANFKFSKNTKYPSVLSDFEESFAFLESTPCDILLTAHPEVGGLWEKLGKRASGAVADPLVDQGQCKRLAETSKRQLELRIVQERAR